MIKTVSFAPPRASSSRSTSGAVPAKAGKTAGRAASGSSTSQSSLSFSFDEEPVPTPATTKTAPKKSVKAETKAKPKTETKAKTKAEAKPKSSNITFTKRTVPQSDKPKLELKGKKVRAPKDLAALYGGTSTEERPSLPLPLEAESPKKRLTKDQREARKVLMKPDEGLLERLARASQISAVKVKSEPRGKGWRFVCGRCGNTSFFQGQAGLCNCGAIALKD